MSLGCGFPACGQPGCRLLQARAGRVGRGSLPAIHLFWQGEVILISKPVSFSYMLRAILSIQHRNADSARANLLAGSG